MTDRREFKNGKLDEIVGTGAHLEHMGNGRWFLEIEHADGTSTALWFASRDLLKPFWEIRKKTAAPVENAGDRG